MASWCHSSGVMAPACRWPLEGRLAISLLLCWAPVGSEEAARRKAGHLRVCSVGPQSGLKKLLEGRLAISVYALLGPSRV